MDGRDVLDQITPTRPRSALFDMMPMPRQNMKGIVTESELLCEAPA